MNVVKRNNTKERFGFKKIDEAITKSASRVNEKFTIKQKKKIKSFIEIELEGLDEVHVDKLHSIVEQVLHYMNKDVAESYRNYRNYKNEFSLSMINDIESQVKNVLETVDRSNSNSNSRYISTKRTDIAKVFAKELYQKIHLNVDEIQALKDGYIYQHDLSDLLLPQFNCCLTDLKTILDGGFELENIFYTEPKDIRTAVGQVGDIIQQISGQHFGGNTSPEIDKTLAKYYKMTIDKYINDFSENFMKNESELENINKIAIKNAYNDLKQALQGLEIKLNTIGSSRGSYPFTTFTFGRVSNEYEADVAKAILQVRMEGHGLKGKKKKLIFPKLVFIYDEDIHGEGEEFEWLFDYSIKCTSVAMYPDYIGKNQIHENKVISPMGCRAYLSDYRDDNGELQFVGRANLGATSLNLPMIYMKANTEKLDFYKTLMYYLEMIRGMHKRRIEYVGKAKASSNPLMFTQGGALGGFLNPDDEIKPLLKSWTISFGITSLNELMRLHNGKSIKEDNGFAVEVMEFINDYVDMIKEEDDVLYAIYSTPAETLIGTQRNQFVEKFGIIKDVSDRDYFTNSFHCHVSEEISPFEKQDKEEQLFNLSSGGRIQYVKMSNTENIKAMKKVILRGLDKGFYQGVNFDSCFCEDCGHDFVSPNHEDCPKCGSSNITEQNRNCGYIGYSRRRGDTTFNKAKRAEIKDRVSM